MISGYRNLHPIYQRKRGNGTLTRGNPWRRWGAGKEERRTARSKRQHEHHTAFLHNDGILERNNSSIPIRLFKKGSSTFHSQPFSSSHIPLFVHNSQPFRPLFSLGGHLFSYMAWWSLVKRSLSNKGLRNGRSSEGFRGRWEEGRGHISA